MPATAVAEVDLWGIYRRNQFIAPRRTPCAAGTRSIFISWDVTSVFSYRWTYNSQASDGVIRSTHYEPMRVSVPLQP